MSVKSKLIWRNRHNKFVEQTLDLLCKEYPNAFFPNHSHNIKPLKLGIFLDIYRERDDVGGRILKVALARYTKRDRYLRALVSQPNRIDLRGEISGEITDDHRQFAVETLVKRQKKTLATMGRAS